MIDTLDFIKMERILPCERQRQKNNNTVPEQEKIFAKDTSERGLLSKIDRNKKSVRSEVSSRSGYGRNV